MYSKRILAFLQNMWHPDPLRVQALIDRRGREAALPRILFSLGSHTGKMLTKYLGVECCNDIIWEEISKEITVYSHQCPVADYDHVRACIKAYEPKVVIAFGVVARDVFETKRVELPKGVEFWKACHPAARDAKARVQSLNSIRERWLMLND